MGLIQSSLNQLTLSSFGALAGLAQGFKGAFKKPEIPQPEATKMPKEKTEIKGKMGLTPKIGRNKGVKNIRSYKAAVSAINSANDSILQKSYSMNIIQKRLDEIKAATNISTKGGSK